MPIVPIPNQPINLEPFEVDPCNIGDNKEYCTLYETSGMGYLQFKQTPCAGNIVSEGNFVTVDDWTADAGWTHVPNSTGAGLDDGTFVHTPGSAGDLEQTISIGTGNYYSVTFTVSDMSAGELEVFIGGTSIGTVTANGQYTFYGLAGVSSVLTFTADSDFNGRLSYVSAYRLQNTFAASLLNADDESVAAVQPSFAYAYDMEYVTVSWSWADVPEGCYKVSVGDPCDTGTSSEILLNNSFTSLSNWTIQDVSGGTQCTTISGGNLNVTKVLTAGNIELINEYVYQPIPFTPGDCFYRLSITFGHVDPAFLASSDTAIDIGLVDGTSYPFAATIIGNSYVPVENGTIYFDWFGNLTDYDDPNFIIGINSNATGGGTGGEYMEIASVSLKAIYDCADTSETLVSNCLALSDSHDCAKRLIADCYPGTGDPVVKYGFAFNGTFKLDHNARLLKFNPFYPTDSDDYEYSSGTRSLTFAKREKYWEGLFDYADENFHDTVSTQILCDSFTIDTVSYFVKPGDYKPEWEKDGRQRLAQARIELRKKSSTIQSN